MSLPTKQELQAKIRYFRDLEDKYNRLVRGYMESGGGGMHILAESARDLPGLEPVESERMERLRKRQRRVLDNMKKFHLRYKERRLEYETLLENYNRATARLQ